MKFTPDLIIHSSYFFVFLFAIIVFFDVLIRFKSPAVLKLFFLLIVIALAITSFCSFIMSGPDQFVMTIMFCKVMVATSLIQIFTNIYFIKHKLIANIYTIFSFVVVLLLIFYIYGFKQEATVFSKFDTVTAAVDLREFHYDLPIYLRLPIYLFFIGFNAFSFYYSYSILFLFSFKNIYFKRVQLWTISFFTIVVGALLLAIVSPFIHIPITISHFLSLANMSFLLLIILYRPNFINKNGPKISFGLLFNSKDLSTDVKGIDFNFHFFSNFYFKNKSANIIEFANIMGVSKEMMFNYIYFSYSMSFDELINKSRVDYFVEIIKEPKYKNYTVEALSMEVGFSSRQRFYQPFKKYHGGNPSDLIDILND